MHEIPDDYIEVLSSNDRTVTVQIQIGYGMDPTAADDVVSMSGGFLPMSDTSQLLDSNYVMTPGLATFEGDGIPSAISYGAVVPPLEPQGYPPQSGVWSDVISDADGLMEWSLDITLSKAHTSAFSLHTSEVHILQARLRFYLGGEEVRDVTVDSTSQIFTYPVLTEYDRIMVTVLRVTQPFHHVRIAEVEFGASITLSNASIGEVLTLISETDPLGVSSPISELDFDLINVFGGYDADNPSSLLPTLPLWTPLDLSITQIRTGGDQVTIPMGSFYITDRMEDDTLLSITAQDARSILRATVRPLSLSVQQSLGDLFEDLLTEMQIPYAISDDSYGIYPVRDATMDAQEWDLLTQVTFIEQMYGIRVRPGRDGFLHVSASASADTAPARTPDLLLSYPAPTTSTTYNILSVQYGDETATQFHEVDLRTTDSEARSVLSISNPLVMTLEEAQSIAQKLAPMLSERLFAAEMVGDAAIDVGDILPMAGRWTAENPSDYSVRRIELTFDGSLSMSVTASR